jgi:hypothetical protein
MNIKLNISNDLTFVASKPSSHNADELHYLAPTPSQFALTYLLLNPNFGITFG